MTALFFAIGGEFKKVFAGWNHDEEPVNILATFANTSLLKACEGMPFARVMLDSGAFSAWNSGATIDIGALIEETKKLRYTESVCLDVIGNAEASLKNALAMHDAGSPAFPVFHYGDPWEHLAEYRKVFGRVGLSCRFGEPVSHSIRWLEQCFAHAWPCRFHSFGWTSAQALSTFPFDTADSTSWINPRLYGRSRAFGIQHSKHFGFNVAGKQSTFIQNLDASGFKAALRCEVRSFLKVQRFLEARWKRELAECRK